MNAKDAISALMAGLAPVVRRVVEERIADATAPLKSKIAQLEARATPKFAGTYATGKTYEPLSFVVDHGSLWIAKCHVSTRPPGDGWQLVVKRGEARP